MREIITFQLGQCGNNIGEVFWDVMASEHALDACGKFTGNCPLQKERINVYFNEAQRRSYARVIGADIDRASLAHLKNSPVGGLIRPQDLFYGGIAASSTFAAGYYTEGAALMDNILDAARIHAESVDCLQGFHIIHSIGGGTGSGMGALLMENLTLEYPDNIVSTFTVIPSKKVSDNVVEPYNSILAFPNLISHSHLSFCIDNEALFDICIRNLERKAASFDDINHIIAHTMSGVTTCFRFPGQLNTDMRKLYVNMVPFPELHFFVPGFAPLTSARGSKYRNVNLAELIMEIFSGRNFLVDIDARTGKFLTVATIFRGRMSTRAVDVSMNNVRDRNREFFVEWIPNNIKTAICDIPPRGLKMSATFIGNTTALRFFWERSLKQYQVMLRRKAYLHWYYGEGMEHAEFVQAEKQMLDLIKSYFESEKLSIDAKECCSSTE